VTSRGTDWGLALLVALGLVSGLASWFAGSQGGAWVFGAHALAGTALALLLVFKLRRVLPRVGARTRRDPQTWRGLLALVLVLAVLVSGFVWSSAGRVGVVGYTVLFWHGVLGALLAVVVLAHSRLRARRPPPPASTQSPP
jgi:cytochrome b561